jgi:hypothetical protein
MDREAAMTNTNVREGLSPSIARGAIYLTDFWEEHFWHEEFEAQSVEDA